jgi:hypothetical protein
MIPNFYSTYFDDIIDYPKNIIHNPLPIDTFWNYISCTYLNGFINHVKPIKWYSVDRYSNPNKILSNGVSKYDYIDKLIDGSVDTPFHTNLRMFEDDCIILAEYDFEYDYWDFFEEFSNDNESYVNHLRGMTHLIMFYYDSDTKDCSIGKFRTDDSKEQVIENLEKYLKSISSDPLRIEQGYDNGLMGFREIPIKLLNGWIGY